MAFLFLFLQCLCFSACRFSLSLFQMVCCTLAHHFRHVCGCCSAFVPCRLGTVLHDERHGGVVGWMDGRNAGPGERFVGQAGGMPRYSPMSESNVGRGGTRITETKP
ncbi:hypothetical protein F5X68DRAFT_212581 [Plectosphaerella plurivora]|uniref:Secreted protein n=1 Tax=Plectosphaerella plurivora TaxID=936078 RepID=A0A9P8V7I6_9PEZI|nr:hypothetical protein F5X68DRAFT_212581 [Plectosphaerella plurivora]